MGQTFPPPFNISENVRAEISETSEIIIPFTFASVDVPYFIVPRCTGTRIKGKEEKEMLKHTYG